MFKIELLGVIQKNMPDFDTANVQDLIKAEKVLKVENKLNSEVGMTDVENLLSFFRNYGSQFNFLFENDNVKAILKNDFESFTGFPSEDFNEENDEILYEFAELFSESVSAFIYSGIQQSKWSKLKDFFQFYDPIISLDAFEKAKEMLSNKNRLILNILPTPLKYSFFQKTGNYAFSPQYYKLQSELDSYYFDQEILEINNTIARHQKTSASNKVTQGKILVAISYFDAYYEDTIKVLSDNKDVGQSWIDDQSHYNDSDSSILPIILTIGAVIAIGIILATTIDDFEPWMFKLLILPIVLVVKFVNYIAKK
ncbi:hypothetical protein NAT51_11950 [Flavobacterium amniphilum]|uniref:hypothetical protein n=1 Tax=Flavobacterium amniphilum TaxID=1834035 RepID=UPI002029C908|nr:hypothetical protein [Flavobacterium amniphilum]MCL9806240.1 hypothetical protein [Flavobacterium amniphilum]